MSRNSKKAASAVEVYVQSLAETYVLEVDPKEGVDGVRRKLSLAYPDLFPYNKTVVRNMDESNPPLTNGSTLMVVVQVEPMCLILSIRDEVLPGTNLSYEVPCRHWHFELEDGTECHVYRMLNNPKMASGSYANYIVTRGSLAVGTKTTAENMLDALAGRDYITPRDAYVIMASVDLHETYPITKKAEVFDQTKEKMEVFCECGCVVKLGSMKQHLKTKVKHVVGDEKGREFMADATKYVKNWSG